MKFKAKAFVAAQVPATIGLFAAVAVGRDKLPEPWDFADHAGNIFATAPMAVHSTLAVLEYTPNEPEARERLKAFRGAALLVTLANVGVETRLGSSIFNALPLGHNNTPDMIDALYGTPYGVLVSCVVSRLYPGRKN